MKPRHRNNESKEVINESVQCLVHQRPPRHVRDRLQFVINEELGCHHDKTCNTRGRKKKKKNGEYKRHAVGAKNERQTKGVDETNSCVEPKRVPALVGRVNQRIQGVTNQEGVRHPADVFKGLLYFERASRGQDCRDGNNNNKGGEVTPHHTP